jgi:hypothetical protein
MDVHKASSKAAQGVIKALDVLTYSPTLVAQILTSAPGPIQHRLYLTIRAVIKMWAIDAKGRTFDPEYREIYNWAKGVDNDRDYPG